MKICNRNILILFGLLVLCLMSADLYAYDFEVDGLCYNKLSNNEVEITYKYDVGKSYSGTLIIPSKVAYNGVTYNVTSIGYKAFFNCTGLTGSLSIPNSVTSVKGDAFSSCFSLTSITIPNSVTSIGNSAFCNCSGLTSITIPNSVTNIGKSPFNGCDGLTSIKVDNNNKKYDSRNNCNAIIETSTNTLITGCKNTVIPNSVTSIGFSAFSCLFTLTSITIPNSVTSIGDGAFSCCFSLTSITIPNSVTSIGDAAFDGCSGLTSITIPNSMTSIGNSAFYGCSGLTSIISEIKDPFAIDESVFSPSYTKATLTVPYGTKSKYQQTNYWNKFTNIKEKEGQKYSLSITASGYGYAYYDGTSIKNTTRSFTVNEGTSATITFSPDDSKIVKVNGTDVTSSVFINQYTINNITANTTLEVEFNYTPNNLEAVFPTYESVYNLNNSITLSITYSQFIQSIINSSPSGVIQTSTFDSYYVANCVEGGTVNSQDAPYVSANAETITQNGSTGYRMKIYNFGDLYGSNVSDAAKKMMTQGAGTAYEEKKNTFENKELGTAIYFPHGEGTAKHTISWTLSPEELDYLTKGLGTNENVLITRWICFAGNSNAPYPYIWIKMTIKVTKSESQFNATYTLYSVLQVIERNSQAIDVIRDVDLNDLVIMAQVPRFYSDLVPNPNAVVEIVNAYNWANVVGRGHFEEYPTFAEDYPQYYADGYTAIKLVMDEPVAEGALQNSPDTYSYHIPEAAWGDANFKLYLENPDGIKKEDCIVNPEVHSPHFLVDNGKATPTTTYTLSVTASGNGYASYNGTSIRNRTTSFTVNKGTNAMISITPDNGYRIKSVKENDSDVTSSVSNNTYTIYNISSYTTLKVEFEAIPIPTYTLSITATGNGSVTYDGTAVRSRTTSFTVNEGTDATVTFSPDNGNSIASVKLNNSDVTSKVSGNRYTINDITANTTLTVTFQEDVNALTVDGVNYTVVSQADRTVKVTGGDFGQVLTVPATVTQNGKTWTVTGIDANALKNNTELAAVIWNPTYDFTATVSNPNLLLYVKAEQYAPSSIQNVVVNGTASNIVLAEAQEGNNFYCPQAFVAQKISYTHNYQMQTGVGESKGWETIALPFDVQTITHETKGTIVPFAQWNNSSNKKPFWLMELTGTGFVETGSIKAYTPYIISMPNNPQYDSQWLLKGKVTFAASSVTVGKTENLNQSIFNGRTFIPCFAEKKADEGFYALNVSNDWETNNSGMTEGSKFVLNMRRIHPFEAYMISSSNAAPYFDVFDDMTTGIQVMDEGRWMKEEAVYDLQGRKVENPSKKGVYIVNGKKMIIK